MRLAILLAVPLLVLTVGATAEDEQPAPAKPAVDEARPAQEPAPPRPVAVIKTSMGEIHVELFLDECPKTVENFLGLADGKKEFEDPQNRGTMVKRPFYDGLIFHRVIRNFMIQGGCPLGNGSGGPGYQFEDEINGKALGLGEQKVLHKTEQGTRPHGWLLIRNQQQFQQMIVGPLFRKMGISSQADFEARKAEVQKAVDTMTLLQAYENMGYEYDDSRMSHHPKKGVIAMANSGPNTNGSQFFINLVDTPHLTGKHTVFGRVVKGMEVVEKIGEVPVGMGSKPVEDIKIISIRRATPTPPVK
jgi:peptidyl-prolyl cis-trans isomerase A (cyclophilin A)